MKRARRTSLIFSALLVLSGCVARSDSGSDPAIDSRIEVTPATIVADGKATAAVEVFVLDGTGAPQSGASVTVHSVDDLVIEQPAALTDAQGHATAKVRGTTPGRATLWPVIEIQAKRLNPKARAYLELTPAATSVGNKLSLLVTPQSASVDVATQRVVKALLTSSDNAPISGATIAFKSLRASDTITPSSGQTLADGTFKAVLKSTRAGLATLTASAEGGEATQASASFLPGAPDAAHTYFLTQTGNEVTADGVSVNNAEVFVGDQYGNPVAFAPVAIAPSNAGVVLIPPSGIADAAGVFHTTVTTTELGNSTFAVDTGTAVTQHNVVLVVGPASALTSSLVISPNANPANGTSLATATLTLLDAAGHPRFGDTIQWQSSRPNDLLEPQATTTDASGTAQTRASSATSGLSVMTAQSPQLALFANVLFVAGPPASATSALTASPNAIVAGVPAASVVQLVLRDASGNPAPGVQVSFSTSNAYASIQPAGGVTDSDGRLAAQVTAQASGSLRVLAGFGPSSLGTTLIVSPAPPAAQNSTLMANPTSLVADGVASSTVVLRLYDAFGNATPNQSVVFSVQGPNTTLTPTVGATGSDGSLSVRISRTLAGQEVVSATVGHLTLTAPVQCVAGPPAAASSSFSLSPNVIPADGMASAALTVHIADATGNPRAQQPVSLFSSQTGDVVRPGSGLTDASGNFSATVAGTLAGTRTLSVRAGALVMTQPLVLSPGPQTSAQSTLSVSPSTIVADGNQTAVLTLTLADAAGNPVPQAPTSFSSTLDNRGQSVWRIAGQFTQTGLTNAQGQLTSQINVTKSGAVGLQAQSGNVILTARLNAISGSPNFNQSTLVLTPNSVVAGTGLSADVSVRDAYANAVSGATITFSASDACTRILPQTASSDVDGHASGGVRPRRAGVQQLQAVLVGAGGSAVSVAANFVVLPGVPSNTQSAFVINPNQLVADGQTQSYLSLQLRDALGNPVPGSAVVFSSTQPNDLLSPASVLTDANGLAQTTLTATRSGSHTLIASAQNAVFTGAVLFAPGAIDAQASAIALAPPSLVANGAQASQLTFIARDVFGNPVANQVVTLSADAGASLDTPSAMTDADGRIIASVSTVRAGDLNVMVQAGPVVLTAPLHAVADSASAAASSFTLSSNTLIADGVAQVTATLVLLDAHSNALSQMPVSFSGQGLSLSPSTATTDVHGIATVRLTTLVAGGHSIVAMGNGIVVSAPLMGMAAQPNAAASFWVASSSSALANGVQAITLTATLRDLAHNLTPGIPIDFGVSDPNCMLASTHALTDAQGRAKTSVRCSDVQQVLVSAAFTGDALQTLSLPIDFLGLDANNTLLTLAITPNALVADGLGSARVVATLTDTQGNVVVGQSISLSGFGPQDVLQPAAGTTDSNGQLTATLSSTLAQTLLLSAAGAHVSSSEEVVFVAGAPNVAFATLVASPNALVADGMAQSTLSLTLADAYGNLVSQAPVAFSIAAGNLLFTSTSGQTDATGSLSTQVSSTLAGRATAVATSGNTALFVPIVFFPGPLSVSTSSVVASPNVVTADAVQSIHIIATARDAFGNPRPQNRLQLTSNQGGNALVGLSQIAQTDSNGMAMLALSSAVAQTQSLIAQLDGVPFGVPIQFVAGAPNALRSTAVGPATPTVADGQAQAITLITLLDAFGNPVPNISMAPTSSDTSVVLGTLPSSGRTGADGTLRITSQSTHAASTALTLVGGNLTFVVPTLFVPGPPDGAHTTWTVDKTTATVDANQGVILTLTAADAQGNPTPSAATHVTCAQGSLTLTDLQTLQTAQQSLRGTTDSAGRFVVGAFSTLAELKQAVVQIGAISLAANVRFVPAAPSSVTTTLMVAPSQVVADGGSQGTLLATVRDVYSNLIPNASVVFAAQGNQLNLAPPSTQTNGAGVASATISSTVAELKQLSMVTGNVTLTAPLPFVAGPASNATSTLTLSPNVVVADGNHLAVVALTAKDAFGNAASGRSVSLASNGVALSPPAGTTDASGVFYGALSSTTAGSVFVQAAIDQIVVSAPLTLIPGPPDPLHSTLSVTPAQVTADGNAQGAVQLTVADAVGNPIDHAPVVLSVGGSNNTLAALSGTTGTTGQWATTVSSTFAELKTMTALVQNVPLTGQVRFVPGPPALQTSTLAVSPNVVTADGVSQAALSLTLADAQGNPIPSAALSLSAPGAQPATLLGTTDSHARFAAQLSSTLAGPVTVTVATGPTSLSTQLVFAPGLPSAQQSTLTASPSQATADGNQIITLLLLARDAFNNPTPNQTVSWGTNGTRNTLGTPSSQTGSNGQASTTLVSTRAQSERAIASFGGIALSTPVVFLPGGVSASKSTLVITPNQLVADGNSTAQIVLTVLDAQGNPEANQTAQLSVGGVQNQLGAVQLVTGSDGQATTTLSATRAETKSITAQLQNFSLSTRAIFVAGEPVFGTTVWTANPNVATADGVATVTLLLSARDAFGNPTPNRAVTFGSDGSLYALAPATTATDAQGMASATLRSTLAQQKHVSATVGSVQVAVPVLFLAGAMSSATSTLTLSPNHVLADGNSQALLQLSAFDAQGNPVSQQPVSFYSSGASADQFGSSQAVSSDSGSAQTTLSSTVAGLRTVTATLGATSLSATLQFFPGAPSTLTSALNIAPLQVVADGQSYTNIQIVAEDAFGNLIPNQNIVLSSSGGAILFSLSQGQTDSSGIFTARLSSTLAESKTLTANLGPTALSGNVVFVPGSPSSTTSSLRAVPLSATADGVSPITVALVLRDAQNNPVPNRAFSLSSSGTKDIFSPGGGVTDASGQGSVQLTSQRAEVKTLVASLLGLSLSTQATFLPGAPSLANTSLTISPNVMTPDMGAVAHVVLMVADALGNPVPAQAANLTSSNLGDGLSKNNLTSDANGQAFATVFAPVAGSRTLLAAFDSFSVSADLQVFAGAPNQVLSSLSTSPPQVTADGVSQATITVVLQDQRGNPVPNQNLQLTVSGGPLVELPSLPVTNSAGTAAFEALTTQAGMRSLTVSAGNVVLGANLTFVPGPVSNALSTLAISSNQAVADTNAVLGITLYLADAFGNPIANQLVTLSASGANNTFVPQTGVSLPSGIFSSSWSSSQAGTKTLVANVETTTLSVVGTFLAGPPSTQTSFLTASPASVVADNLAASTLTISLADVFNNPIVAQPVAWSTSGSQVTLSKTNSVTNSSAQASITARSSLAQGLVVSAQAGNFVLTTPLTFVPGPPDSAHSTLGASPVGPLTADGQTQSLLTAFVRDAFNNPVPNQTAVFTVSGSGAQLVPQALQTDATGRVTAVLSSTVAETKTITLTAAGATETLAISFVAGSPNAVQSSFVASPNQLLAGGNIALAFSLRDAFANPIGAQNITLLGAQNLGVLQGFGPTNAQGLSVATLLGTQAQSAVLQAVAAGVSLSANVRVDPNAVAIQTSSLTVSPNVMVAGGNALVTVVLNDMFGNPVPNQNVTWSGGNAIVASGSMPLTDATGATQLMLGTTLAQNTLLVASTANTTLTAPFSVIAGAASPTLSSLTLTPNIFVAGGNTTATVSVVDAFGNPLAYAPIQFLSPGSFNVVNANTQTQSSGIASSLISATLAQSSTISSQGPNLSLFANVQVLTGPPSAATSSLAVLGGNTVADGNSWATIRGVVLDVYGNPIINQAVQLSPQLTRTISHRYSSYFGNYGGQTSITVNGTKLPSYWSFWKTYGATQWYDAPFTSATFQPGNNLVSMYVEDAYQKVYPYLDYTDISYGDVTQIIEAETLTSSPNTYVDNSTAGYNGQGYRVIPSNNNCTLNIPFSYTSTAPKAYLSVRYQGTGGSVNPQLSLNGNVIGSFYISYNSAGFQQSNLVGINPLQGNNLISLYFPVSGTTSLTQIDEVFITKRANLAIYQAENAQLSGNLGVSSVYTGYTGTGYVVNLMGSGNQITYNMPIASEAFSPSNALTDANGVFVSQWASTAAETKNLTTAVGNVVLTTPVSFVPGPISTQLSSLILSPNSIVAGQTAALILTLADANRNPIAYQPVTISGGTNLVPPGTVLVTDLAGSASFVMAPTLAQNAVLQASAANVVFSAPLKVIPGAPNANTTLFAISPNTQVTADAVSAYQLTGIVADIFGNPIPGQSVQLTSTVPRYVGVSYSTANTATQNVVLMVNGVTQSSNIVLPGSVGFDRWRYSAGYPVNLNNGNNTITYANFGNLAYLDYIYQWQREQNQVFEAEQGTLSSNAVIRTLYPNYSGSGYVYMSPTSQGTFQIPFNVSLGAGKVFFAIRHVTNSSFSHLNQYVNGVSYGSPTFEKTASPNVWAWSPAIALTAVEGNNLLTLTATTGSDIAVDQVVIFQRTPSTLVEAETGLRTGSAAIANTTVGYSGSGYVTNVVGAGNTLAVTVPVVGDVFSPAAPVTDQNGNFAVSWSSSTAETKLLTVGVGNIVFSNPTVFLPGTPSLATTLVFGPSGNTVIAGSPAFVGVQALDALGNPVSNIPLGFSASAANDVFGPGPSSTDAWGRGQAPFVSTKAGSHNACIQVGSGNTLFNACISLNVVPAAPSAISSQLNLSPNASIPADTVSAYSLSGFVGDAFGNPIAGQNIQLASTVSRFFGQRYSAGNGASQNVVLTVNGVTQANYPRVPGSVGSNNWRNTFGFLINLNNGNNTVALANYGNVLFMDSVNLYQRESNQIFEAEQTTLSSNAIVQTQYSNYAGSGYVYLSSTSQGSLQLPFSASLAGGNIYYSIRHITNSAFSQTLVVLNGVSYGTPAYEKTASPNLWTWSPPIALNAVEGNNLLTLTAISGSDFAIDQVMLLQRSFPTVIQSETGTLAGSAAVGTSATGYTGSGYVTNVIGSGNTLSITVPISGEVFSPSVPVTDQNGNFVASWTSSTAETKFLTAGFGNVVLSNATPFSAGTPSYAQSLVYGPSGNTAIAGSPVSVGVQILDAFGNPVPNISLSYSASGANNTFGPSVMTTDSWGRGQAPYMTTSAGGHNVCIQVGGGANTLFNECVNLSVSAAAPNALYSTLSLSPNLLVAGGNVVATATFFDVFGNPALGNGATFAAAQNFSLLSQGNVINAAGAANATLRTTLAQNAVIQVQSGSVTLFAPLPVISASPNALYSSLSLSPNTAIVSTTDLPIGIVGHVADVFGNPITNQNVSLVAQVPRFISVGYSSNYAQGSDPFIINNKTFSGLTFYTRTSTFDTFGVGGSQSMWLQSGNNTVSIINSDQPLYIDYFDVSQRDTNQLFEAENLILSGNASVGNTLSGFAGSGYVILSDAGNSTISVTVASGLLSPNTFVSYRYHCAPGYTANANVLLNGNYVGPLTLNGANPVWPYSYLVPLALSAGNNTISLQGGNSSVYVDQVALTYKGPTQRYEAENGFINPSTMTTMIQTAASGGRSVRMDAVNGNITVIVPVGTETISPNFIISDANGNFVASWRSVSAENKNLVAVVGNIQVGSVSALFSPNVLSLATSKMVFGGAPDSNVAGGTALVSLAAMDALSNPLFNNTVVWSSSNTNDIFKPSGTSTSNFGLSSSSFGVILSGNRTISAQIGNGLILTAPFNVVPAAPSAVFSYLSSSSNTAVANNSNTIIFSGRLADAYNNVISNTILTPTVSSTRWLSARYTAGLGGNANWTGVVVNGLASPAWVVPDTFGWVYWQRTQRYPVVLNQGNNVVSSTQLTAPPSNWDSLYVSPSNANTIFEAENAKINGTGVVSSSHPNYSGTGYVDFQYTAGSSVSFTVPAIPGDLNKDIAIRYSASSGGPGYNIVVNGNVLTTTGIQRTADWNTWAMSPPLGIALIPGNNIISVVNLTPPLNVDYLQVFENALATQIVQAEAGALYGGSAVASNYAGYQGTGFVDFKNTTGAGFSVGVSQVYDTFMPGVITTDPNGTFSFSLTSMRPENKQVALSLGGLTFAQNIVFLSGTPQSANSQMILSTSTAIAGTLTVLGVYVGDSLSNPVGGIPVAVSSSPNIAGVSNIVMTSDSRGFSGLFFVPTASGTSQICANFNAAFTQCSNLTVVAGAPNVALSSLSVSPNQTVAGASVTYAGSMIDSYGNLCSNQNISIINQSGGNAVFGPFSQLLDANGKFSSARATASAANFVVTIYPEAGTFSVPLTVSPNVLARFNISALRSLPAGLQTDIQVTATDAYNNIVQPPFNGTIVFTSTDNNAILASPYTYQQADNDSHLFIQGAQLFTQGNQTITATHSTNSSIFGKGVVFVQPPIQAPIQAIVLGSSPNLCLTPSNFSSTANTTLGASICIQTHTQAFTLGSDQTWRVLNQCVQPFGGVVASGQNLVLAGCTRAVSQRWAVSGNALVSVSDSNYCVDVTSAQAGGVASLVSCGSANAPRLTMVEISRSRDLAYEYSVYGPRLDTDGPLTDTYVSSRSVAWFTGEDDIRLDGNKCVNILNASLAPNSQVSIAACTGGNTQKWVVNGNRIVPKYAPSLCLSRKTYPAQIINCNDTTTQNSYFSIFNSGYGVQVKPTSSMATNLCLQSSSYPAIDNSNVLLAPCSQSYQQIFTMGGYGTSVPAAYIINNIAAPTTGPAVLTGYLYANLGDSNFPFLAFSVGGGNQSGLPGTLISSQNPNVANAYRVFRRYTSTLTGAAFMANSSPQVLFDANTALYGNVLSLGAFQDAPSRLFVIEPRPAMIASSQNLCLSAQNGNMYFNQGVFWSSCAQAANQKMFFPYSMGIGPTMTTSMPISFNGLCLDANGSTAGSRLVMTSCNYATSQYWQVGAGPLGLQNGTGLCLDGNGAVAGGPAQVQNCTGMANQNVAVNFF